jgi:peroxiredoxin Q/BCP
MPPKRKTEAEPAAVAPAAGAAPKEPKPKKEKVAKEPKEPQEPTEPARRSTRIKDLPPKADAASLTPASAKKKRRGDNKNDPDNMEYKPGGASARKGGKKRKKASANEDDDEADEEEKPKKKLKSEAKVDDADDAKEDSPPKESGKNSITVGSVLPDLILKNEKGDDIQIADLTKETGVIIFAIPKADTPGCTKQACHFRDNYDEIRKHGFAVYALSADSGALQARWQSKNNLPYSMLSDSKRVFIEQLGVKNGSSTTRSHFIFEKGTGKLLQAQINVKPEDSHKLALEFIKGL